MEVQCSIPVDPVGNFCARENSRGIPAFLPLKIDAWKMINFLVGQFGTIFKGQTCYFFQGE